MHININKGRQAAVVATFQKRKQMMRSLLSSDELLTYGSKCTHAHTMKGMPAELELRIV